MASLPSAEPVAEVTPRWPHWARQGCFWLLIVTLAWAPFPLGSNREWSWGFLSILTACCWFLWVLWARATPRREWENLKRAWMPLTLAMVVLAWAVIQTLPIVPLSWVHPLWSSTGDILTKPIAGSISLNPWRTANEATKLSTYIAAAWMAFTLARNEDYARKMLNAWIVIGASYAAYAFVLALLGMQQFRVFYALGSPLTLLSGPFVQRNNFATYEGLTVLAGVARLVEFGHGKILASKGARRLVLTGLQFLFGSGVWLVIATTLAVSALIASASRGGSISTLFALAMMAVVFVVSPRRERNGPALIGAAAAALVLIGMLVWINGGLLSEHFLDLVNTPDAEYLRRVLWGASSRMVISAPWLGLGLGTFQDAYPMYATKIFPYIMDKAHNDYLEFAAGLGLPAAILWWTAVAWLVAKFLQGIWVRRKNRIYPLLGVGATTLVGTHSLVDFSLQMPAIAFTYAVLLGLALGQAFSGKRSENLVSR